MLNKGQIEIPMVGGETTDQFSSQVDHTRNCEMGPKQDNVYGRRGSAIWKKYGVPDDEQNMVLRIDSRPPNLSDGTFLFSVISSKGIQTMSFVKPRTNLEGDVLNSEVRFKKGEYSGDFGDSIDVEVVREGSLDQTVTVTVKSYDVTAAAGTDYDAVDSDLTFAANEISKTVTITTYNTDPSAFKQIKLVLEDPSTNCALGNPSTVYVVLKIPIIAASSYNGNGVDHPDHGVRLIQPLTGTTLDVTLANTNGDDLTNGAQQYLMRVSSSVLAAFYDNGSGGDFTGWGCSLFKITDIATQTDPFAPISAYASVKISDPMSGGAIPRTMVYPYSNSECYVISGEDPIQTITKIDLDTGTPDQWQFPVSAIPGGVATKFDGYGTGHNTPRTGCVDLDGLLLVPLSDESGRSGLLAYNPVKKKSVKWIKYEDATTAALNILSVRPVKNTPKLYFGVSIKQVFASFENPYSVTVDAGSTLDVTVLLGTNYTLSEKSSVHLKTTNGTALAGTHYDAIDGTVVFNAGTVTRTIKIKTYDVGETTNKTFTITMSDPSDNLIMSAPHSFVVTINEPTTGVPGADTTVLPNSAAETVQYGCFMACQISNDMSTISIIPGYKLPGVLSSTAAYHWPLSRGLITWVPVADAPYEADYPASVCQVQMATSENATALEPTVQQTYDGGDDNTMCGISSASSTVFCHFVKERLNTVSYWFCRGYNESGTLLYTASPVPSEVTDQASLLFDPANDGANYVSSKIAGVAR